MKQDTTLVSTAYFAVIGAALVLVAVVEHVMGFGAKTLRNFHEGHTLLNPHGAGNGCFTIFPRRGYAIVP